MLSQINYRNIYSKCPSFKTNPRLPKFGLNLGINYIDNYKKCEDKAVQNYFDLYKFSFHSMSQYFSACNDTLSNIYNRSKIGSMASYLRVLSETEVRVLFYAGDWDDIVPETYILENINKLGYRQSGQTQAWINVRTNQHLGFKRTFIKDGYNSLKYWIIKGASHDVPKSKPEAAF